jgi:hypothetical protein
MSNFWSASGTLGMATHADPHSDDGASGEKVLRWSDAGGPTSYAMGDGTIKALLYWENAEVGELDGPGGDPIFTSTGWFVVLADDPQNHVQVDAPELERGMADEDLVRATEAAMDAATRLVADQLNAHAGG